MKAIKKLPWLVSLVLVVAAVILGSNISLHALSGDALAAYQTEKWGNTTIGEETQVFATKIYNYLKVTGRYVDGRDEDIMALSVAVETFTNQSESVSDIHLLKNIEANVVSLGNKIQGLSINDRDQKYIQNFIEEWKNYIYILSNHPYNQKALAFNEALKKFPANGLKYLTNVRALPVYRSEIIEKK